MPYLQNNPHLENYPTEHRLIENHPVEHCLSDTDSVEPSIGAKSLFLTPFQRKLLLKSLQTESRSEYRRRIEIILLADAGQTQTQICTQLGCSQETARFWITMTQAGQAHCWNQHPIGRPKIVNDQYLDRLKELVNHSPKQYGYAFRAWTARWLSKHLAKELGIEISDRHVNRLLKQMGLSCQQHQLNAQINAQINAQMGVEPSDDRKIVIANLPSSASPESCELWQFKSMTYTK